MLQTFLLCTGDKVLLFFASLPLQWQNIPVNFHHHKITLPNHEIPILTALMKTVNDNMGISCDQFVKNK
jgi:hypothetical protein